MRAQRRTHRDYFTSAILGGNLKEKCRTRIPRHPFCASLRSGNAHGHVRRVILHGNLQEKCWTRIPRHPFCASLRSRNAPGQFTRAFCAVMYRKNAGPLFRGRHFVRACAVETHMDISQEPFFAVTYRKKCRTLLCPPRLNTGS